MPPKNASANAPPPEIDVWCNKLTAAAESLTKLDAYWTCELVNLGRASASAALEVSAAQRAAMLAFHTVPEYKVDGEAAACKPACRFVGKAGRIEHGATSQHFCKLEAVRTHAGARADDPARSHCFSAGRRMD